MDQTKIEGLLIKLTEQNTIIIEQQEKLIEQNDEIVEKLCNISAQEYNEG